MSPEQAAAYVIAQATCANAEIAAMQANNIASERRGERYAPHAPAEFLAVPDKYCISHNAVLALFSDSAQ